MYKALTLREWHDPNKELHAWKFGEPYSFWGSA